MSSPSYYEVLGVAETSSQEEIKKSYKKLAMKWHPDKNRDSIEVAEVKFKQIGEAYETLGDPAKRREYDESRSSPRGGSNRSFPRDEFSAGRAHDIFENFFREFNMYEDEFAGFGRGSRGKGRQRDPFGDFFGGGMFGGDFGGAGFGGGFGGFEDFGGVGGGGGFTSSSFSSSSSRVFNGSGRSGRSTSSTTTIDSSGRKVTKTTETIFHPDGTQETNTEEFVEDAGGRRIVDQNRSGAEVVAKPSRRDRDSGKRSGGFGW